MVKIDQLGLVESVKRIKNPIKLARKISEETKHVFLVGDGAELFAEMVGAAIVVVTFHSDKNLKRLKAKSKLAKNAIVQDKIGTVGAVALDKYGNISAATSTGGIKQNAMESWGFSYYWIRDLFKMAFVVSLQLDMENSL